MLFTVKRDLGKLSAVVVKENRSKAYAASCGHDTVILAYPNYWGMMSMAVFTFLERYDFSGKTILPRCTNEGSGMGSGESDIRKAAKGDTVRKGLAVTGSNAANAGETVKGWASTYARSFI